MMITMRMKDQKREQAREDRRERERVEQREKDELREERRQQEQARLLTTLREAQLAVPQRVTINNHKVPLMKEVDYVESFVVQLEAALVSLRIPRDDWRQYVHSQVTLEAKEKIMHLLTDNGSTYDDIRAGMMILGRV